MKNLGYTFYKDYFSKLEILQGNNTYKPVFDGNKVSGKLYDTKLNDGAKNWINQLFPLNNEGIISFELQTVYPGLLIGSGYIHEIGSQYKDNDNKNLVQNELKLGFYFDYTTGLPVIPGSSVKGVLRSAFEKANGGYVQELLEEITGINWTDQQISKLELHIFEGKDATGNDMSMYKRDIFFDAFPVRSDNPDRKFLANDYITPHKDPLKNPNPIQFLKILPQVTFQFNFRLHDFKDGEGNVLLPAEQKKELFKRILLDLGIGAKTNVGYGQFVDPKKTKDGGKKNIQEQLNPGKNLKNLQDGEILNAIITNLKGGVSFDLGFEVPFTLRLTGVSPKLFTLNQKIKVKVKKQGKRFIWELIKD